jgi:hypothetical protein
MFKTDARRAVHDAFAVDAVHTPGEPNGVAKALKVRWHSRNARLLGDLQGQGYGEIISMTDRMVFNVEQLSELGITTKRGDRITVPSLSSATFVLDAMDPSDGPVTQAWAVARVVAQT